MTLDNKNEGVILDEKPSSIISHCVTLSDWLIPVLLFPRMKIRDSNNFPLNLSVMKLNELIHLKHITVPDTEKQWINYYYYKVLDNIYYKLCFLNHLIIYNNL